MLEKGIHDQYEEQIFNMLDNGDQKSWRTSQSYSRCLAILLLIYCIEHAKINPLGMIFLHRLQQAILIFGPFSAIHDIPLIGFGSGSGYA
jgi:hypothetical protein